MSWTNEKRKLNKNLGNTVNEYGKCDEITKIKRNSDLQRIVNDVKNCDNYCIY